jgi:hypothetical protein
MDRALPEAGRVVKGRVGMGSFARAARKRASADGKFALQLKPDPEKGRFEAV